MTVQKIQEPPFISRGLDPSHEISSQFIDHLLSWQKLPTSHKTIFKILFLLSDKSSWHKTKKNYPICKRFWKRIHRKIITGVQCISRHHAKFQEVKHQIEAGLVWQENHMVKSEK